MCTYSKKKNGIKKKKEKEEKQKRWLFFSFVCVCVWRFAYFFVFSAILFCLDGRPFSLPTFVAAIKEPRPFVKEKKNKKKKFFFSDSSCEKEERKEGRGKKKNTHTHSLKRKSGATHRTETHNHNHSCARPLLVAFITLTLTTTTTRTKSNNTAYLEPCGVTLWPRTISLLNPFFLPHFGACLCVCVCVLRWVGRQLRTSPIERQSSCALFVSFFLNRSCFDVICFHRITIFE